ncbi:hypothetical protein E2C01_012635 [Portunus trituberculatus]|uniref:Uncharacterized protein n=1 Tax=Portunus trituberculatus TaxID=210409 RepID=A0A5B7DER3_PORTR|nr:hypothetical protein [Portunus trituberculatus]
MCRESFRCGEAASVSEDNKRRIFLPPASHSSPPPGLPLTRTFTSHTHLGNLTYPLRSPEEAVGNNWQ